MSSWRGLLDGRVPELLERGEELARAEALLNAAREGGGGILAFEGPAGIGKTSLLRAVRDRGQATGAIVHWARGAELEQDFAFGVVRQWLDPVLASPDRRRTLLTGAAVHAGAVLVAEPPQAGAAAPSPAALHGLHWLIAALAEEAPRVFILDDAHWSDHASLRLLAYLAGRLDELPVAIVAGARAPETLAAGPPAALLANRATEVVPLAPLSLSGTQALLGERTEAAFAAACHEATRGNPFLLGELRRALAEQGVEPVAAEAARVRAVRPHGLSRAVLARLPADAQALARAVAIFDDGAGLADAASLASLDRGRAEAAADALGREGILENERPLRFAHPIVRDGVLAGLGPLELAAAHRRAADLLRAGGAPPDRLAGHLLRTEPAGDPAVVENLRAAATRAAARGAPEAAVTALRRALAEPPAGDLRLAVLLDLAQAELTARDHAAPGRLREAIEGCADPVLRASLRLQLAIALFFVNERGEAHVLLEEAIEDVHASAPAIRTRVYTQLMQLAGAQVGVAEHIDARVPELEALAAEGGPGARGLAVTLVLRDVLRGGAAAPVRAAVARELAHGRFLAEETAESPAAVQAICALAFVDALDDADELLDAMAEDAARGGSVMAFAAVSAWRSHVAMRRGRVAAASAEARAALTLISEHGLWFAAPFAASFLAAPLIAAGALDEADAVLAGSPPQQVAGTSAEAFLLDARGRLRADQRRPAEAALDLRACGAVQEALLISSPVVLPWRSALALSLPAGEIAEACALVDEELRRAQVAGVPRAIGVALRTRALLSKDTVTGLEQSLDALEHCPSPLERAITLSHLGAALRRDNRRADAREPLREALDLAERLGARSLAADARAELVATGARPRQALRTGVEALSPHEHRVAAHAAAGASNPEIAQALFISRKTVEMHLGNVYRKLGISSRTELPRALSAKPDA